MRETAGTTNGTARSPGAIFNFYSFFPPFLPYGHLVTKNMRTGMPNLLSLTNSFFSHPKEGIPASTSFEVV